MRAAVFRRTGPAAEVLAVEEIEAPLPGPGEVRVRVTVSAVNPTDFKERSGSRPLAFAFKVPDQDGAGVIESVGDGVDPARVGERVWLYFAAWQRQFGTAAQLCTLSGEQAVAIPDGVSDDLAASMGIPALTAHRCLFADGPVEGRTVLVAGGAGAVGHFAVELARWGGAARVIATASSPAKAELSRAAGADAVVDYRADDAVAQVRAAAPDGVDRIVEVALHRNLALDREVVADHASVCAYADGGPVPVSVSDFMARNVALRFVLVYTMPAEAVRAAVADVTAALSAGALTELPAHRFALDDIAAAHDAVEAGAVGKVLVDVG